MKIVRFASVGLEVVALAAITFAFRLNKFQNRSFGLALSIVLIVTPLLSYLISTQRGYTLMSRVNDAGYKVFERLPLRVQKVAPYIGFVIALLVVVSVAFTRNLDV